MVILPATALADKKDEAKAHVVKATKAHKDGHFEEARVELEAAYALDPNPDLLYAIGQVYAKLGKCGEATTFYKRFVATQKDPQVAKVVDQAIAACKPADAAATPLPSDSPPTPSTTTTASKAPVTDSKPSTTSKPAAPNKPAPPDKPAPAAPPPQSIASMSSRPAPVGTQQRSPWYEDKLGDGLVLGGVVATIVGLVEYSRARSDLDKAEDYASTSKLAAYQDLVDSAHSKRTASVVLIGAGGALITAGIVHYVLRDRAMETRGVAVAPAHGGGVVTYEGRF